MWKSRARIAAHGRMAVRKAKGPKITATCTFAACHDLPAGLPYTHDLIVDSNADGSNMTASPWRRYLAAGVPAVMTSIRSLAQGLEQVTSSLLRGRSRGRVCQFVYHRCQASCLAPSIISHLASLDVKQNVCLLAYRPFKAVLLQL